MGLLLEWTPPAAWGTPPTEAWLGYYGLQRWEAVLDQDLDGSSAEDEYAFGTDPWNPLSHPPRFVQTPDGSSFQVEIVAGIEYGSADLETSTDLVNWERVPGFPPPAPSTWELKVQLGERVRFYRLGTPGLVNSDADCLLDFEELNLFHTDPLKADTDGDGLDDCAELLVYHTDPTHGSSTGRGTIQGRVVFDVDRDPLTQNHAGIGGWTVFVDLNFDGHWDSSEPSATSLSDGTYRIGELDPGFYRVALAPQPVWVQIFPTVTPMATPDGFPDRVSEVFDSGTGPIPFPYGRYADPLPGQRVVFPSPPPVPVEASVILGPLPPPPIAGPFGGWSRVRVLAIPTNSFVTVAFDGEEIIDGPGPDLAIWCAAAAPQDSTELSLGSTPDNLAVAGVYNQVETILVDLAALAVPKPVRYVKLRGLGMVGTYPGIDVVGLEALHYQPLTRGHYDITVLGGQTVEQVNFGVSGDDRPPKITISTDRAEVRAGEMVVVQVRVSDDVAVASAALTANGVSAPLDPQGKAIVPVASGGLLTLAATATDTAGQTASTFSSLLARNEDGSLPDLSGLGVASSSAEGGPSIIVQSPVAGEILSVGRPIIGSIQEPVNGVARWEVHYALADAVNPEALDAADPDYVLLSEGTGAVMGGNLGTFAGDTLPAGAYLIRVTAVDSHGTTRYAGFVVGVRIDPLEVRPTIMVTAPVNDENITYLTQVRGSITTRQQLREWLVEYAPLREVNLQNLADPAPRWTLLSKGNDTMTNGLLATFDPTLLPNDAYVIRVSAWNKNGLGWAEPVVVQVTGHAKLGDFSVEFTDVQLPLAGVPITLKRVYNSLNAAKRGDFGYGWSLGLQTADIAETVPQAGRGLGSTPFRVGTRVYLTAPNGQRVGFTLEVQPGPGSLIGTAYRARFKPDPGIRYTLSVPEGDSAFLSVRSNGELVLFFLPVPWNPDTYILTDEDGTHYSYDQDAGLLEILDRNGVRVSFTETAITHSAGPTLRLARDGLGRITQVLAPDGRAWSYHYDERGDLARVIYPGDQEASFIYSTNHPHFLERIQDPLRSPSLRAEYDAQGRMIAMIDAQGNRHEQSWDPGTFTGTYTDARGFVSKLTYDARGNLTRREDPLGGVTTWEFRNPNHPDLVTAVIDPLGNRTAYSYDARGNRTAIAGSARKQTTFAYNEHDRLTEVVHLTGGKEQFDYDSQGNLIRYRRNLPAGEWAFTYTPNGTVASVLDPEGGLTRFEYDQALGLPNRIVAPDGALRQLTYDATGQVLTDTDALGGVTRYEYDSVGRLVRQVDAAGAETRTTYDASFLRQPSTVKDRAGRVTQYTYDALGHVSRITRPGGAVTRYEYDPDGYTTAVVDPLGNRWQFEYDALGQGTTETDPLGRRRLYVYDKAGNLIEAADRNGRRRIFEYDGANRLTKEQWLDPTDGKVVRTLAYEYDSLDRLRSATDPDSAITWYWLLSPGRLLDNEQASYSGLPQRRIASTYDKNSRRVGLSTATGITGGWSLAFTRDLTGRLRIVTSRPELTGAVINNVWQLQSWVNARGDVTELRRFADQQGEKLVSRTFLNYSVPCACRLERIEHVVATNQPMTDASMVFTRDAAGDITQLVDGADVLTFAYDQAAQLASVGRNGVGAEGYSYDLNGNRTASHRHLTYSVGSANRLNQAGPWSLRHDDEGNLISKSNTLNGVLFTYTWDHRNRLTRVQRDDPSAMASAITEYRYDGVDRRIGVLQDGHTTWTYYDGLQPVMDFVDQETVPTALYFSGERLDRIQAVWRRDAGAFWTLTDHLGSVRRVLSVTNGLEAASLAYDSFGNPTGITGLQPAPTGRFAFAGREWDEQNGLYYQRARYYDPELGCFISEDPSGFRSGDVNPYRYVRNNPINRTDPLGLSETSEEGLLNLPSQMAKEAICDTGAELASVYISAAIGVSSPYVSAAIEMASGAACNAGAGGPTSSPRLTPDEIRLNALLELPPTRPWSYEFDAGGLWLSAFMGDKQAAELLDLLFLGKSMPPSPFF